MLRGVFGLAVAYTLGAAAASGEDVGWAEVRELLSHDESSREASLESLRKARDPTLLAGLNDLLYYYVVVRDRARFQEISALMEDIAGESMGDNPRRVWTEWIGRHQEIEPQDGYLAFKRFVFERYDRAFRGFLQARFTFRVRPEEIEWGGVGKDGIPALDQPGFIPGAEAKYLKEDDRVFGVYWNGEAKAYPHNILDAHEMANDVVGGLHVSLSYCTLCGSGILYNGEHPSREGKKPFTFGSSGLLYRSNKLMYDRPTNSLWNNLTGEPVAGRLAESGLRLEKIPLVVSTWGEWRKRHPDTLVLDADNTGFERDYSKSPYEEYFSSDGTMFPVWLRNDALEVKSWVFALVINGTPKAYPLELLKEEGITHDELGGEPIVLVTNRSSGAVRAYETKGRRFVFISKEGSNELGEEGGSARWKIAEDALVSSSGERLARIPGHKAFWFGWYAFYPTTEIYGE